MRTRQRLSKLLLRHGIVYEDASSTWTVKHRAWLRAQTVSRLRCLRGIDTLSAVGLAAEVGDFTRFERPGRLMSYLGLVPSEASSGRDRRQGRITKTGSRHARRLLVEASWHYRKTPARGTTLQRRQDGQAANIIAISWQAQRREAQGRSAARA
ncbi:MAG: transposase [Solirubrobacteraceae bacterium]